MKTTKRVLGILLALTLALALALPALANVQLPGSSYSYPVYLNEPSFQVLGRGQAIYLSALEVADSGRSYQWLQSLDGVTWTEITGATNITLTLSSLDYDAHNQGFPGRPDVAFRCASTLDDETVYSETILIDILDGIGDFFSFCYGAIFRFDLDEGSFPLLMTVLYLPAFICLGMLNGYLQTALPGFTV